MLRAHAAAGRASSLASFSGETLNKLGIRGNGHFRIDRYGHSAIVTWVRGPHPESRVLAATKQIGGATVQIDNGGQFGETLHNSVSRNWVAYGSWGETVGRLTGPVQFVRNLMEFWRLDIPDVVRLLGYDSEDIEQVSAVLDGRERFRGRDVKDRIAHLFCIRRSLWSLFRDPVVENDWLREQHSMLNEKSPLSLMLEGSMEDLLLAREYVESAAGIR